MKQDNIVTIERLNDQGQGIAHIDGKVVFVLNALTDEIVEIEITEEKKKFSYAKVVKYIRKSKNRISPHCLYANTCGGCDIMHLSYEDQLRFKQEKVERILNHSCQPNVSISPIIENKGPFYYRNKITLQVDGGFGFFQEKCNKIVKIKQCLLVNPRINQVIEQLQGLDLTGIKQIMIRASQYTSACLVVLIATEENTYYNLVEKLKKYVTGIILSTIKGEKTLFGTNNMVEKMGNWSFRISAQSFFQVNTEQAIRLYDTVVEFAKLSGTETVLDLYCGTGTIGIYLSKYAKQVYGIEINDSAVVDANINKEINHVSNIEFKRGNANEVSNWIKKKLDLIVVDPPRGGLDDKTIESILKLKPQKIIYVSCDPMTLGRDLQKLLNFYNIAKIQPFDLFSQTEHCEVITFLELKS